MDHVININITNYCQSKCVACPRTNTDLGSVHPWLNISHAPLENVKLAIRNLCSLRTMHNKLIIKLCGDYGDPMMHPDIENIIYFAHLQPEVTNILVATNGGLRNKKFYRLLGAKYKKLSITFGIDGTTSEMNSKYRDGVNFEKAWDNMMGFHELSTHGKCAWQYLVFSWNIEDIENAFIKAAELNLPLDVHRGNGTFGDVPEEEEEMVDNMISNLYEKYFGVTR